MVSKTKRFFARLYREWIGDDAVTHAAAVAFFAMFSITPMLVLLLYLAALLYGEEAARGEIVDILRGYTGVNAAMAIEQVLARASREEERLRTAIVSGVVLLVAASRVFRQLKHAMNRVWDVPTKHRSGLGAFVHERFIAVGITIGIAAFLLTSMLVDAGVSSLGDRVLDALPGGAIVWGGFRHVIGFCLVTLLFASILKWVPDISIGWNHVWVGAAVSAGLFSLGQFMIGLYVARSGLASAWGAAASLIVLLLWVFFTTLVLFLGAEVSEILARPDRRVRHDRERRKRLPDIESA